MTDIRVAAEQARVALNESLMYVEAHTDGWISNAMAIKSRITLGKMNAALASLEAALAALPGDKVRGENDPPFDQFAKLATEVHSAATPTQQVPQIAGRDGASDEVQEASVSSERAPCRAASSPLPSLSQSNRPELPRKTEEQTLTMRISYERAGRCFWHLQCTAQHHAPPMAIDRDDKDGKRTLLRCTAWERAGWYPYGSVGEVSCEEQK